MTLVELIMVATIGAFFITALHQVLVVNQRAMGSQSDAIRSRQSLRAAMSVLSGELREISPGDGDLVSMSASAARVRSARTIGLLCSVVKAGPDPVVRALKVGRFLRGDSVRVLYENHPSKKADDSWRTAALEVVDSTGSVACPGGDTAQDVQLVGVTYGFRPDSIVPGAPIRSFIHQRYALETYQGRSYLARTGPGGTARPLVGPLDPAEGLRFRYLDSLGAETTTAADVRQVELTVRAPPDLREGGGPDTRDSLLTRIHVRN